MTTVITRLYPDAAAAKKVVSALLDEEFPERYLEVITRQDQPKGGRGTKALIKRIQQAKVYRTAAEIYAPRVGDGEVLLVLQAPFGSAERAKELVDRFPSIDAGVKSNAVLLRSSPKVKIYPPRYRAGVLTKGEKIFTGWLFPAKTSSGRPMTDGFVWPLLWRRRPKARLMSDRPTPFSSMLSLPVLIRRREKRARGRSRRTVSEVFAVPLLSGRSSR